jgi:hypothetical protein
MDLQTDSMKDGGGFLSRPTMGGQSDIGGGHVTTSASSSTGARELFDQQSSHLSPSEEVELQISEAYMRSYVKLMYSEFLSGKSVPEDEFKVWE